MCTSSGPSASQDAQIRRQNQLQSSQFDQSQQLARDQFAFQQDTSNANFAFQQEQAAIQNAAAEANYALAQEQLGMQASEIDRQIQREYEREQKIQNSISAVNEAFQGREGIFDRLKNDTLALNRDALDKTKGDADRNLAFALTRAGRRFDSLERDKSAATNERYNEGLIDANTFAQGIANNAKAQDASLRQGLLASATSGQFDGQELVSGAAGTLNAIASTEGGLSNTAANRSYFNDIPNSINQLAGLFAGNGGGGAQYSGQFRPGQSTSRQSGRVSNAGV